MSQRASNANGPTSNRKTRANASSQPKFPLEKSSVYQSHTEKDDCCFPKEQEQAMLKKLIDEDMLVFRYCDKDGKVADGKYPDLPQRVILRHRWNLQQRRQHLRFNASSREGDVLVAATQLGRASNRCFSTAMEN